MKESGEVVFVDSTGDLEEHNLRFFLLCTHSIAGALPLGILITSDEKEETLRAGFAMLCVLLGDNSFYGKGAAVGPSIVMSDNCDELRLALRERWPSAVLLLCVFHMLQQVWRWLYDRKHGITADDRAPILKAFKSLLYAETEANLNAQHDTMIQDPIVTRYPNFVSYLADLIERKVEWALCFRADLLIRDSNTNNLLESQFLFVKDTMLRRYRLYNVNELINKLFTEFESHYQLKLMSVADSTFDGIFSRRFKGMFKFLLCVSQHTPLFGLSAMFIRSR